MTAKKQKPRSVATGRGSKSATSKPSKANKKKPTPKTLNRASAEKAWAADLKKSCLTLADAKKHNWKLLSPAQTQKLTKTDKYAGAYVWSYLIVYRDIKRKDTEYWRVRYLEEVTGKFGSKPEKPRRYTGPQAARLRIYLDPTVDYALVRSDGNEEILVIVEGEKKTACASKDGFSVFGIGGVNCWMQDGAPLPDFDLFAWKGRDVVLFFDSDYKDNADVERALSKLAREIKKRGATVFRADPPSGPNGEKWGYDDCRKNLGKRKTMQLVADAEEIELPPDLIDTLNDCYYVAPEGPNVRIFDERDGTAYSKQDFLTLYMNQYVEDADGKLKPLGDQWLKSPNRRQYTQTIFAPDVADAPTVYNRYKGFAFEPMPGDWSLLLKHIQQNICSADEKYTNYILDWMARGVQYPGKRAEVAIVLRGEQGTGKGVFVNAYAALFAPHTYHASSASEVTGQFVGHIKDVLFIFLDEAFFAGDKSHVGTLKKIITEKLISVEEKYKQRIEIVNRLKIIIASNEHWVVPAGRLERRFFVLDVSTLRQQQTEYFGALIDQLNNGGYEAFFYDLLQRDLSSFDHRNCPRTEALSEQQLYSMTPVEAYWSGILDDGVLPVSSQSTKYQGRSPGWGQIVKQELYDDFIEQARKRGLNHLPDIAQFGRQLGQLLPGNYPKTIRPRVKSRRAYVWQFPSLITCRKYFSAVRGGPGKNGKKG